jgi:hypothetical protein
MARRRQAPINLNTRNQSFARDGLLHIDFSTNVRNLAQDITRRQENEARITRNQGEQLTATQLEPYTVFNSDQDFNIDSSIPLDVVLELLTVPLLQGILRQYQRPFQRGLAKRAYIDQVRQTIQIAPKERERYVRQILATQVNQQRQIRAGQQRDPNRGMFVSNRYKYQKSDFKDMKLKDILRSLFIYDYYIVFIKEKVLKDPNAVPISRAMKLAQVAQEFRKRINNVRANNNGMLTRAQTATISENLFAEENKKANEILKHNVNIVLSLLFAPRRPFFVEPINKKPYTVLGYSSLNPQNQDPARWIVTPNNGQYTIYDQEIHLELSDQPPDKVSDKLLRKTGCHLQKQKIRDNWHEITGNNNRVFERNYRNTLKRRYSGGAKSRKIRKTRKYKRNNDNKY